MKRVLFLSTFLVLILTIGSAFSSINPEVSSDSRIKILKSDDGLKNTVVVDCNGDGKWEFECVCSSNCNGCLSSATIFIAGGGCGKQKEK